MLLIQDRGWEDAPKDDDPPSPRARTWHLPWRPCAWFAVWCWLMALVPIVNDAFGGLASYGVLLAAVALVCWRIDRWCGRQYRRGLRDYKL
ncbi:MAG: hypothetical protein WAL63_07420 [Solirubrobacteraceae bacterium]